MGVSSKYVDGDSSGKGKIDISVCNKVVDNISEMDRALARRLVRVINVCAPGMIAPLVKMLEEKGLYFMAIVNFTREPAPSGTLVKHIYDADSKITDFNEYLEVLRETCGGVRWPVKHS